MEDTDIERRVAALEEGLACHAEKLEQVRDLLAAVAAMLTTLRPPPA